MIHNCDTGRARDQVVLPVDFPKFRQEHLPPHAHCACQSAQPFSELYTISLLYKLTVHSTLSDDILFDCIISDSNWTTQPSEIYYPRKASAMKKYNVQKLVHRPIEDFKDYVPDHFRPASQETPCSSHCSPGTLRMPLWRKDHHPPALLEHLHELPLTQY